MDNINLIAFGLLFALCALATWWHIRENRQIALQLQRKKIDGATVQSLTRMAWSRTLQLLLALIGGTIIIALYHAELTGARQNLAEVVKAVEIRDAQEKKKTQEAQAAAEALKAKEAEEAKRKSPEQPLNTALLNAPPPPPPPPGTVIPPKAAPSAAAVPPAGTPPAPAAAPAIALPQAPASQPNPAAPAPVASVPAAPVTPAPATPAQAATQAAIAAPGPTPPGTATPAPATPAPTTPVALIPAPAATVPATAPPVTVAAAQPAAAAAIAAPSPAPAQAAAPAAQPEPAVNPADIPPSEGMEAETPAPEVAGDAAMQPAEAAAVNEVYNPETINPDEQAAIDDMKKRYEDIIVIYMFMKKCGKVNPADYNVITHALGQEMASVNAPGRLQNDVLTAARGSFQEIYSKSPCDGEGIQALTDQYNNYIQVLADNYPPE